jgi:stress response protein SCP2
LTDTCIEKIKDYYKALPTLGKVYIADNFYKLGMPTNTSASGKGIDVLPIGSRLPCTCNNIRTFVHWKDAFDIDSSLIIVDKDNNLNTMGWFNYGSRPCGYDISFSGDITGRDGAEFFDIDINALAKKGYKYVVQTFHGYCSKLDSGEIYAGYQNKSDLNTAAWDSKNIEMQFKVRGDSRGCIAFAIDIQNREVIILNQIIDDDGRVIKPEGFKTIEKYLQPEYLDVNIGMIAECRGKLQLNPADADVVFDDTYVQINPDALSIPEQTVIRSWELEKLVAFINN